MPQLQNRSDKSASENSKSQKTTPCQSIGISKTLLTPCRRLGLSRKVKITPPSHNQSSPDVLSTTCSSAPASVLKIQGSIDTLPSGKSEKFRKSPQKRNSNVSSRASIQSRFQVEDVHKCNSDLSWDCTSHGNDTELENPIGMPKSVNRDTNESKRDSKKSRRKKVSQKPSECDTGDIVPCTDSSKDNENIICIQIEPQIENVAEQTPTSEPIQNIKDPPEKCVKLLKEKPIVEHSNTASRNGGASNKAFNRRLSMKRSSCSQDEVTDIDSLSSISKISVSSFFSEEFAKECVVNSENIIKIDEESDGKVKFVSNKSKKRLIVYSSDEDDFVSSQHSISKKSDASHEPQDENWSEKIAVIKERIKKKEQHLADLKQAAVYRKLHNVEELKQSTKIWKKCCEDGLTHLLPKLQEHGQMDMPTLMKNLNIPKTITYDIDTDGFK